ncbi:MAG: hypothetical protein JSR49_13385 [Proteobacteria bacterium]|nr:hypothetical protein [Pseudomonadota bacterium]
MPLIDSMAASWRGLCGVRYFQNSKLDEGFELSLLHIVTVATAKSDSIG